MNEQQALDAFLAACREGGMDGAAMKAAMRALVLPQEPPPGLLMSMAIRYDHGLGRPGYYDSLNAAGLTAYATTHAQRLDSALRTMRQLYEEVSGHGFYSPEREAAYAAQAGKEKE
jgi:hypothetical protein